MENKPNEAVRYALTDPNYIDSNYAMFQALEYLRLGESKGPLNVLSTLLSRNLLPPWVQCYLFFRQPLINHDERTIHEYLAVGLKPRVRNLEDLVYSDDFTFFQFIFPHVLFVHYISDLRTLMRSCHLLNRSMFSEYIGKLLEKHEQEEMSPQKYLS